MAAVVATGEEGGGAEDGAPAVVAGARRERERRSERGEPWARERGVYGWGREGDKKTRVGPIVGMDEDIKDDECERMRYKGRNLAE
jgi:hypothetical protein